MLFQSSVYAADAVALEELFELGIIELFDDTPGDLRELGRRDTREPVLHIDTLGVVGPGVLDRRHAEAVADRLDVVGLHGFLKEGRMICCSGVETRLRNSRR